MGIFNRLGNIISGKANKALDGLENPIEQIEVAIRQREEAVNKAKRESASFIGSIDQKHREVKELKSKIVEYENGIRKSLKDGNEEMAGKFLAKKNEMDSQLHSLETTVSTLEVSAEKVKHNILTIEKEVNELKMKKSELAARYSTAEATAKVNEIITHVNKDANVSLEDIEAKIVAKENYASGLDAFKKENPDEELHAYLNSSQADTKSQLDKYRE